MNPSPPPASPNDLSHHLSHSDSNVSNGHAQEVILNQHGESLHKIMFSSRESIDLWRTTISSFLGRSIRQAARVCINASCHARYASTCLYFFLSSGQIHSPPSFFSRIPVLWSLHRRSIIGAFSDLSKLSKRLIVSYRVDFLKVRVTFVTRLINCRIYLWIKVNNFLRIRRDNSFSSTL